VYHLCNLNSRITGFTQHSTSADSVVWSTILFMTTTDSAGLAVTRRAVLAGAAALGAVTALAACGGDGGSGATATGPVTLKAADVPVSGGKILADSQIVVTQPTAGSYKAFSAVCTHQGCLVASVQNDLIRCACHNSLFSAADGSVQQGPATSPLPARTVKAEAGTLTVT
jgi:nitrite reductase/ring-hydroxylating ferredoxin subunit